METSLPRPCEMFAAGGAKSCGGRAKALRRPSKTLRPFFQTLQTVHRSSVYLFAKIQKKRRKCKFFVRFFFLLFSLQERPCSAGCRSRGSLSIDNKDIATWVQAALPRSH